MSGRTFVVTVNESPSRVVVEDVRSRRRAVAADLAAVGGEIATLLETARSLRLVGRRQRKRRSTEPRATP